MNLKPFDLQQALAGAKMVTRGGKEVTQIVQFKEPKSIYVLAALVDGIIETFTIDGYFKGCNDWSDKDVFLLPCTVTRWVNVYRGSIDGQFYTAGGLHISKEVAESYIEHTTQATIYTRANYIATVPITFEQ
jgi:hypothetical protein